MTHDDASKQPENRHDRQRQQTAEQRTASRHRATQRTSPPGRAEQEKRLQRETEQSRERHSETDTNTIRAKDGSNTALQFSGKRMRRIHIDSTGTIEPISEWQPVNLPRIARWVRDTSPTQPESHGTFYALGDTL